MKCLVQLIVIMGLLMAKVNQIYQYTVMKQWRGGSTSIISNNNDNYGLIVDTIKTSKLISQENRT